MTVAGEVKTEDYASLGNAGPHVFTYPW